MKKMIKSLSVLVFLFVLSFVLVSTVSADAPVITAADGASLRTTGDNQGIKFTATLDTLEGVTEHGFLVAKGVYTLDEMKAGANEKQQKVALTGTNKTFNLVIFGLDSAEDYLADLTVVAYAVYEGGTSYGAAVTRNMAEVALVSKTAGETATLVSNVITAVTTNHKYVNVKEEEIIISDYEAVASLELAALEAEFVADVNEFCGSTLTSESTMAEFSGVLANVSWSWANYGTDISNGNAFKFFQDPKMNAKWGWIADYLVNSGANNTKLQAFEVLDDGIYSADQNTFGASKGLFGGDHFASELWLILNQSSSTYSAGGGYLAKDYTSSSKYETINQYCKDSISEKVAGLVAVNDTITLPAAVSKTGYTWNGWSDGTTTYAAGDQYTVTVDAKVVADLTAIEYSINYYNGATEYTELADTYTVEDTVTLPSLDDAPGLTFAGWYTTAECDGEVVTEIVAGTTGDQVFYAKWVEGYAAIVVDAAYAEQTGTVTVNDVEYTIGSDAQATIAGALELIQENGIIYVAAGTYEETLTISVNNVTIQGPNAEVAGNGERAEEAVLNNSVVTLAASVAGTEFVGLKFTGTSQIVGVAGAAGTASAVKGNHDEFLFENNYVATALTSGNGFIAFAEASSGYTTNPQILNNYFTTTSESTALTAVVYLDNTRNLKFNNNVFTDLNTNAFYVNDKTKGLSGTAVEINGNTFNNVTGYAIHLNWVSHDNGATGNTLSVSNNTFNGVSSYCVFFGSSNASDAWAYSITGNTFTGTIETGVKFNRTVAASSYTVTGNVFETEPTSKYFANGTSTFAGTVNVADNTYPEGYDTSKFDSCVTLG